MLNDAGGGAAARISLVDWSSATDRVLIQIPAGFQELKAIDLEMARDWRNHTRELFETAFSLGYVVVDLLHEDSRSYYVLRKEWYPDED